MIQTEYLNDGTLIKHYSDAGFLLLQNEKGIKYSDPIDAVPCMYTYTETDELIKPNVENEEETTESEVENIEQDIEPDAGDEEWLDESI